MTKSELRTRYKEKRSQLSVDQINQISASILENLKLLPIWENTFFHVFVPIRKHNEINTLPLIDYLFEEGKTVIVPKTEGNHMLSCQISSDVKWTVGNFGVPEPVEFQVIDPSKIQVVFVPMLICDKNGNRIGYGGGFYDRFFENIDSKCVKIGLNYFAPIDEISEIEATDKPIDYCVTADEIVSFST